MENYEGIIKLEIVKYVFNGHILPREKGSGG